MPHVTSTLVSFCRNGGHVTNALILSRGYVHSIKHYEQWLGDGEVVWKISTSHLRSDKLLNLLKRQELSHTILDKENIGKLLTWLKSDVPEDTSWKDITFNTEAMVLNDDNIELRITQIGPSKVRMEITCDEKDSDAVVGPFRKGRVCYLLSIQ